MAEQNKTVSELQQGEKQAPPNPEKNNDANKNNSEDLNINDIVQKQIEAFKSSFMENFNAEYNDKLSKLQSEQNKLSEKKQQMAVLKELKAANLDGSFIDFVYDKDIEVSKVKIKQLNDCIAEEVNKGMNKRLESSYKPPINSGDILVSKSKPKYVV